MSDIIGNTLNQMNAFLSLVCLLIGSYQGVTGTTADATMFYALGAVMIGISIYFKDS